MSERDGVEMLGVEPVTRRARAALAAIAPTAPAPPSSEERYLLPDPAALAEARAAGETAARRKLDEKNQTTVALFETIAMVLAARMLLLLGLLGAFALAVLVWFVQSLLSLETMIAYDMLVLLPLVWLEYKSRPAAGG